MNPRVTKADEHLRRADHVMRGLIDERGPIHPERDRRGSRPDPYEAIARAIVGQQLSTKAAALDLGAAPGRPRREPAAAFRAARGRIRRR